MLIKSYLCTGEQAEQVAWIMELEEKNENKSYEGFIELISIKVSNDMSSYYLPPDVKFNYDVFKLILDKNLKGISEDIMITARRWEHPSYSDYWIEWYDIYGGTAFINYSLDDPVYKFAIHAGSLFERLFCFETR